MFEFVSYNFDFSTYVATFKYRDQFSNDFSEKVHFVKNIPFSKTNLNAFSEAMKLAFLLIGISYYKAHPTTSVIIPFGLTKFQKDFLNTVYTDGLSQYMFENKLFPHDLVNFSNLPTVNDSVAKNLPYTTGKVLALQSGGKDSILTAAFLDQCKKDWSAVYIGSTNYHPEVINQLNTKVNHIVREVDINGLKAAAKIANYKNGHVPVTYILMSIATVQAILNEESYIITSIGHEGEEPHSIIYDTLRSNIKVNHQWSKTFVAEQLFAEYLHRFVAKNIQIGSILRGFSELRIAELFAKNCWAKYGKLFSSCNVANYRQQKDNTRLEWCSNCAKCANSYLFFAPFVPASELREIFGSDLFQKETLFADFKGLLGINDSKKPFECVGEVNELRQAYHMKKTGYADLPFTVPLNQVFDYKANYPVQDFVRDFLKI